MIEDNHNEPEKTEAISEEVKAEAAAPFPICPHCGADPVMPNFRQFNIGPVRAVTFFCTACRKVLPCFLLPSAPPQAMVEGPRILRP